MGDSDSEAVRRAEERLGKVLRKKWQLDDLLGIGGMAAVYSATHRNGKRAAIKVLQPEAALIPDVKARFLREGYLANKVGHAGAVSILDDDVDEDGTVFLVMELLTGETLEQRWQRQGQLPWQEMLPVAYEALAVLIAAHSREIIHRDLKPGNVFLDADTGVKILDFGIARLQTLQLATGKTGHDTALGTPGFMPPEQARGRSDMVDARSDLFGLGATLFAVMSGRHLHEAETVNEQLMLAMTEQAESLAKVAPDIPADVSAVIDRALRYEKDERYPDAIAMRKDVADVYEKLLGTSISRAPRLSVLVGRMSRSVHPDAPTLEADSMGGSKRADSVHDRNTTTRPVSERATRSPPVTPRRRWLAPALVGAVVVLAAIAWALLRPQHTSDDSAAKRDALSTSIAAMQPEPPPIGSETATDPPSSGLSGAPAASLSHSRRLIRSEKPVPPKEAEKPTAKPAASVDIFQRRQ